MEETIVQHLAQLGAAGLMGLLWVLERRHGGQRERELTEAHLRLMENRTELGELIGVVKDNTAALSAVRAGQEQLSRACEQVVGELRQARSTAVRSRSLDQAG